MGGVELVNALPEVVGFLWVYSGFLPLEILTGLVVDQDGYSANPSIAAVLRINIGS